MRIYKEKKRKEMNKWEKNVKKKNNEIIILKKKNNVKNEISKYKEKKIYLEIKKKNK